MKKSAMLYAFLFRNSLWDCFIQSLPPKMMMIMPFMSDRHHVIDISLWYEISKKSLQFDCESSVYSILTRYPELIMEFFGKEMESKPINWRGTKSMCNFVHLNKIQHKASHIEGIWILQKSPWSKIFNAALVDIVPTILMPITTHLSF